MDRSPARLTVPRALGAAVLVGGLLVAVPLVAGDRGPLGRDRTAYAGTLESFRSCGTVLQFFKEQAPDHLVERAGGEVWTAVDGIAGRALPGAAAEDSAAAGAETAAPPAHSTTNVQEAGVDEPDLVKTDGRRIVAVAQGRVHLIETSGGTMTRRATLADSDARNVFLAGDRLLVFGGPPVGTLGPDLRASGQRSVLTMYDIADLGRPVRRASLTVDGEVLDARLVGTQVRVATVSSPDVDAPSPVYTAGGGISAKSKAELRAAVARTTVDDWIPGYVLRDGADGLVSRGRLVECDDLARPEPFSGLDTVAVTSFDIGSALESRRTVGVVAGGQQIYATDVATYVSSTEWRSDGQPATTSLHKFVTAPSGTSTYRGSGEVPGTLLNSYAMSEHEGVLRVASTVSGQRGWTTPRQVTEGVVTTLREQQGALRQLGQVGGLGREDNESIRAVRFIEEQAYVVTFRQTDPLYVLDLREPATPRAVGELKIPGYSGYLHPVGADRLLGVGQSGAMTGDVADPGRGGTSGVQFSLFDVSDPTVPRRIDTQTYGDGTANAEFDPRAFLYWEPRDLVVAPMTVYDEAEGKGASGLVLLRAGADGLRELGRLDASPSDGLAQRSVVIGDVVFMLTDSALSAYGLDTHDEVGRLTF